MRSEIWSGRQIGTKKLDRLNNMSKSVNTIFVLLEKEADKVKFGITSYFKFINMCKNNFHFVHNISVIGCP